MPELPEVETVRAGLESSIISRRVERVLLYRENLRYSFPALLAESVEGKVIDAVRRRAKYLLFDIGKHTLISHLGMSGTYFIRPQAQSDTHRHDHMVWQLDNGMELVYHDPRRFGFLLHSLKDEVVMHPMIANLGIEPLGNAFDETSLRALMEGRTMPIKSFLLDQRFVAGIGNIYACEALYRANIHPAQETQACQDKADVLVEAIKYVLNAAISSGGSTLRNYANVSGGQGYFQHHFNVYGRAGKPCICCATSIERITQAGRSTFFCPSCQSRASL